MEQSMIGENKIHNINLNKPHFISSHIFIDFETDNKLNKYMSPFLVSVTSVIVVQVKKLYYYYNMQLDEFIPIDDIEDFTHIFTNEKLNDLKNYFGCDSQSELSDEEIDFRLEFFEQTTRTIDNPDPKKLIL